MNESWVKTFLDERKYISWWGVHSYFWKISHGWMKQLTVTHFLCNMCIESLEISDMFIYVTFAYFPHTSFDKVCIFNFNGLNAHGCSHTPHVTTSDFMDWKMSSIHIYRFNMTPPVTRCGFFSSGFTPRETDGGAAFLLIELRWQQWQIWWNDACRSIFKTLGWSFTRAWSRLKPAVMPTPASKWCLSVM